MPRQTAATAKPLPLAERAKLIDFREPAAEERAFAETLVPTARRALARRHAQAA